MSRLVATGWDYRDLMPCQEHTPGRTGATSLIRQIISMVSSGHTQWPRSVTFGHYAQLYMWLSCEKAKQNRHKIGLLSGPKGGLQSKEEDPNSHGLKTRKVNFVY